MKRTSLGRQLLGKQLMAHGLLLQDQLKWALEEQKKTGELLGKLLQRLGYVSEEIILSVLADQAGVEKVNLEGYIPEPDALRLVPESFARAHIMIPLFEKDGSLTVAIADPFNIMTIEEIERLTGLRADTQAATETDILRAIDQSYGQVEEESRAHPFFGYPTRAREKPFRESSANKKDSFIAEEKKRVETDITASVVELVDRMITQAVQGEATDIHLEPKEKEIRCRFRIDGILHERTAFLKDSQSAMATRLKIMANLNIAENRLPQDGKIRFPFENKKIDLRLSTFPTTFGEKIVLRVLDKGNLILGLEQLGFSPSNLTVFKESILKPHGIILATGPTGSGKTTTLYSALSYTNSEEKNIVTLEDPVEYEIPELCQSQINLRVGLTFASGLRAILRQDPDVILVGEVRDAETVEVAIRAAITGHLVFSTLHTNDAVGAVTRLLDMKVEAYLLASSLVAIIGQRLVRRICPHCKEKASPKENLLKAVKIALKDKNLEFYQGRGCDRCYRTGYRGRIGIFEILPMSSSLTALIVKGADSQTLKNKAQEEGMTTMLEDGLQKVSEGITTLEEVVRVAYGS